MPEVKTIYDTALFGSPDPSGLMYDPLTGKLMLVDSEADEAPVNSPTNFFTIDPVTGVAEGRSLAAVTDEPTGIAYNETTGTLFITDDDTGMVYEVDRNDTSRVISSFSATDVGVADVEGITTGADGHLFLIDSDRAIVETTANGDFVSRIDLPSNIKRPQAIAYDGNEGVFYVAGAWSSNIYKVSTSGEVLDTIRLLRDYRNANNDDPSPTGLEIVHNADGTTSLWVADRGDDQVLDGRLFEITLDTPAPPPPPATPTVSVTDGTPDPQQEQTDGQIVFSVELSEPVSEDVTVTYSTVDGTATAGEDFVGATNATVTIAAGSTSAQVTVDLLNDDIVEADEQFTLEISSAAGAATGTVLDLGTTTGTGTIADDDTSGSAPVEVTLTFQQGVGGYTGTIDTMLQQESPAASAATASEIGVDTGSGREVQSLLAFKDLFGSGPGQIPAGATIVSATLTLESTNGSKQGGALHRMLDGWTEEATWSSFGDGVETDGTEAAATADVVTGSVTSDSTVLDVTESLQAWASAGTTATDLNAANLGWVFTAGGTDGWDFYASEGAVAPQLTVTYTVDGTPPPPTGPTVSISNGSPTPQWEQAGGQIVFAVTLSEPLSEDVAVTYSTVDGAAKAGEDFVGATNATVTIAAGSTSAQVTVDLLNDDIAEDTESFTLELSSAVGMDSGDAIDLGPASGTGTIVDDDASAANTIRVPEDYATIQEAVDAAEDGDTILVAPGTHDGGIIITGKSLTLTSYYDAADPEGDPSIVDQTIIRGGSEAINVTATAPNVTIKGFHFIEANYAIELNAPGGRILDNFFDDTEGDAVSFEEVGGLVRGNRFFSIGDDAVDVDGPLGDVVIEDNYMDVTGNDGIEIRNYDYNGPLVTVTISNNIILGSREDGIQIIDYAANSDRMYIIEGNLIEGSKDAGLGLMDQGESNEDFRAASMPERILVLNNTFDNNTYAITGGDNLIAVNNIISNSEVLGLKNVDGGSVVAYTLFYNNATDHSGSNVDTSTTVTGDPQYSAGHDLQSGSAAIDAGTATFVYEGETILDMSSSQYSGETVDLGWSEFWF